MRARCALAAAAACLLLAACGGGGEAAQAPASTSNSATTSSATSGASPVATADGLGGRLVVGYQGWFGCPGDFDGNSEWVHWFNGAPSSDTFMVDMLPDVSALAPADLCDTGLTRQDGQPLRLFSSQNRNVVDYHFSLMAQQGVGAVALQRFVVELADDHHRRRLDNVLANVMRAADRHGVPFFLAYDVTGADPAMVIDAIRADWQRLDAQMQLTQRGSYLHDHGKPVIELWGFGFTDHPGAPHAVRQLVLDLKSGAQGLPAATVIGGVPSHWRTLDGDAQADPAWAATYLSYDVLSPWTVGRYSNNDEADGFFADWLDADRRATQVAGQRYLPVIFPGFSWYNLMKAYGSVDLGWINKIPRQCGRFLLHQADAMIERQFSELYVAMFDEVDEGTALLPAQPTAQAFPLGYRGVALDEDGCSMTADAYLKDTGSIARALKSGTPPPLP